MRALVEQCCRDLLRECIELVGEDPFERVEESTRYAQPAIFLASLANWSKLEMDPNAAAGHSLGEFAALVAAGVITSKDGLRTVVTRGRLMADADPNGSMVALLGTDEAAANDLATECNVVVANDNAPGQLVLSGDREDLKRVRSEARARGIRSIALNVAGAFHSPSMQSAVEPFRAVLAEIQFNEAKFPVYSCASAAPFTDFRNELADALIRPVRWRQTVAKMQADGVTEFCDVGPGAVLARMVKRIVPDADVQSASEELTHV